MNHAESKAKKYAVEQIKCAGSGREIDILRDVAGIPDEILRQPKRERPCPKCGGNTRCRLIDPDAGAMFCSHCFDRDNGDYIAAVRHFREVDFMEALRLIGEYLDIEPTSNPSGTATSGKTAKETTPKQLVGTWVYTDQANVGLYRVKRYEWVENGKRYKKFFQERFTDGQWTVGLKGVEPVPYNWPSITERSNDPVYIVEGEKCCDVLSGFGFLATTASGGSNSKLDWSKFLFGRKIVIFPDNDKPGFEYALHIADQLHGSNEVKVVFLPEIAHKDDVADWIAAGGTRDELVRIVKETPLWDGKPFRYEGNAVDETGASPAQSIEPETKIGPVLVSFDEIEETEIEWLLQDVFPRGMVSVLAGKPGQGKSFMTCWLASIVSGDDTIFFRRKPVPSGSVIICNAEDNAGNTIKKRLRQNGANLSKVKTIPHVLTYGRGSEGKSVVVETPITLEMVGAFRQAFNETPDCRLLIVDPVSAFWGEANDQKNAEVRVIVSQLKKLAEETGVAIVLVTHLNKSMSSDSSSRITGSGGLPAAGRANWLLSQDESGLRTVSLIKTNVSENSAGFTFRILDGRVAVIDQEIAISADEVLQAEIESRIGNRGRKPDRQSEAEEWLMGFLQEGRKPVGGRDNPSPGSVHYEAKQVGHSISTIDRASLALDVIKQKELNVWFWSLPKLENKCAEIDSPCTPANSGAVPTNANKTTCEASAPSASELRGIRDSGVVDLLDASERPPDTPHKTPPKEPIRHRI